MRLVIFFLLISLQSEAQLNKNILWESFVQFGVGSLDGINQTQAHHNSKMMEKGWSPDFWGTDAWKNKYSNYDAGDTSEKFLFSKNLLVWTTDGYHMTRTFGRVGDAATGFLYAFGFEKKKWYWYVADYAVLFTARSLGFHFFYTVYF